MSVERSSPPARHADILIIGAGAAGMAAAVAAARTGPGPRILLLEKNDQPGRKLLATGNGRCNISNRNCPDFEETAAFLSSLGILLRTEGAGRVYPYAEQAVAVRDALVREMARLQVEVRCGAAAENLQPAAGGFRVQAGAEQWEASRLILTTGGKAGPQYGCAGDGYRLARRCGHTLVSPLPALVQMTAAEQERGRLARIKGVRAAAAVQLLRAATDPSGETPPFSKLEAPLGEAAGEIQFTEYGLSGICIFDLSRHMRQRQGKPCIVRIDLAPDYTREQLRQLLAAGGAAGLSGIVHHKIARLLEEESVAAGANDTAAQATFFAGRIKELELEVNGTRGWKDAQVTAGGIPLSEINPDTMASRLQPGLYLAGEILDYDGPCGGYNLNHAWASGLKAGRAAAAGAGENKERP